MCIESNVITAVTQVCSYCRARVVRVGYQHGVCMFLLSCQGGACVGVWYQHGVCAWLISQQCLVLRQVMSSRCSSSTESRPRNNPRSLHRVKEVTLTLEVNC